MIDLCMPIYRAVEPGCFMSMMGAQLPENGVDLRVIPGRSDIVGVRNGLAEIVAKGRNEFSAWVDADISFPADGIVKLWEAMQERPDAGVVTGLYRGRQPPHDIVCFRVEKRGSESGLVAIEKPASEEVIEVDACGAGFMLVRNEVIRQGSRFDKRGSLSEDLSFCAVVKARGWKVYALPSVRCGHETVTTLEV